MGTEPRTRRSGHLPEGVEIRPGKKGERIRITFSLNGERRRETLEIPVTASNIKYASNLRGSVITAIKNGKFDYQTFFPDSRYSRQEAKTKKRYLLSELIDSYIDTVRVTKSQSPSSVATWVKWARSRVKPGFDGKYIDEIDTPTVRTWIVGLVAALSNKSVKNCVTLLTSVLNRAVDDRLIADSPMRPIKLKTLLPKRQTLNDIENFDIDPFNKEEIRKILDACKRVHEKALFQFAFSTGLRTGELIALKWEHCNFEANEISVIENVVSGEKGTEEKLVKMNKPRVIPMLPSARAALMDIRPLTEMKNIGGYVFSPNGETRWLHDSQIRARWRIILKLAKVRYRKPYQTRHTFASTLLMNGEAEILVANLLGHTTVEMVRKHYGRFIKQEGGIKLKSDYAELGQNLGQDLGQRDQRKAS